MKIATETLAILSALEVDGAHARITGQLDRKTYTRVNDVLEACGGKWNRKAKAHVFPGDAAEALDAVILAGEVTTAKDLGFFRTPDGLAAQLVAMADVRPGHRVLEPSAGDGALVRHIVAAGAAYVAAYEIDAGRASLIGARSGAVMDGPTVLEVYTADFLQATVPSNHPPFHRVVMNPPFGRINGADHFDHVHRAFDLLGRGGVLVSVLPAGVEFRQDRKHKEFREWLADRGGELGGLDDGSFSESGTDVRTSVIRVGKAGGR